MSAIEQEKSMLEVQVQLLESALKSSIAPILPIGADNHGDMVCTSIQQPGILTDPLRSRKAGEKHSMINGKENSDLMQIAARELALI
jgi:hypothetical protein